MRPEDDARMAHEQLHLGVEVVQPRRGWSLAEMTELVQTVPCPADPPLGCRAPAGSPCVDASGRPLRHLPGHDVRRRAAGVEYPPE